jgi:hypothetical protein
VDHRVSDTTKKAMRKFLAEILSWFTTHLKGRQILSRQAFVSAGCKTEQYSTKNWSLWPRLFAFFFFGRKRRSPAGAKACAMKTTEP